MTKIGQRVIINEIENTLKEASVVIKNSKIRRGELSSGLFWWDYIVDNTSNR